MKKNNFLQTVKRSSYFFFSSLFFALLLYFQSLHQFWGDEAQAYLLARDSKDLTNLLQNIKYEGTPPLWHFLIFVGIKFWKSIEILKIYNFISYLTIAIVLYYFKNVKDSIKLLFLGSYFVFFEWGLISRSYLVGVALVLAALVFYQKQANTKNVFLFFLLMGMAAQANGHTMLISAALAFSYVVKDLLRLIKIPALWVAGSVFASLIILAYSFMLSPGDRLEDSAEYKAVIEQPVQQKLLSSFSTAGEGFLFVQRLVRDEQAVWMNNLVKNSFTQKIFNNYPLYTLIFIVIGVVMMVLPIILLLKKDKTAALFYILSFSLLIIATVKSPYGISLRHKGFFLFTLFLSLLIANQPSKIFKSLVVILLIICCTSNLVIAIQNLQKPFSNSESCANYLLEKYNQDEIRFLKVGGHYWQMLPILAYTHIPTSYVPQIQQEASFIRLDSTLGMKWAAPVEDSIFLNRCLKNNCDLILHNKRNDILFKRAGYKYEASFIKPSIQKYERYFIYTCTD